MFHCLPRLLIHNRIQLRRQGHAQRPARLLWNDAQSATRPGPFVADAAANAYEKHPPGTGESRTSGVSIQRRPSARCRRKPADSRRRFDQGPHKQRRSSARCRLIHRGPKRLETRNPGTAGREAGRSEPFRLHARGIIGLLFRKGEGTMGMGQCCTTRSLTTERSHPQRSGRHLGGHATLV